MITEMKVLNKMVRGSLISFDILPIREGPCFITAVAAIINGPESWLANYLLFGSISVMVFAIAEIPPEKAFISVFASSGFTQKVAKTAAKTSG